MVGGSWEHVASYVNNGSSYLSTFGGTVSGDLYGANSPERETNTPYKMVYEGAETVNDAYEKAKKYKGDGVYETSNSSYSDTGSWFSTYSRFTTKAEESFCGRSGWSTNTYTSTFFFSYYSGYATEGASFRPIIAP